MYNETEKIIEEKQKSLVEKGFTEKDAVNQVEALLDLAMTNFFTNNINTLQEDEYQEFISMLKEGKFKESEDIFLKQGNQDLNLKIFNENLKEVFNKY